ADGVDVRNGGAAMLVGGDSLAPVELDADLLQPEVLDGRPAACGHEHQVGLDRLAAKVDSKRVVGLLNAVAGGLEVERDAALLELLGQLLRRVRVLLRDQLRQHLVYRDLGAEAMEDRGELAADNPAA